MCFFTVMQMGSGISTILMQKYIYIFAILIFFFNYIFLMNINHRLRPIDTHLALYTMLYNNTAKNRYAEPVLN